MNPTPSGGPATPSPDAEEPHVPEVEDLAADETGEEPVEAGPAVPAPRSAEPLPRRARSGTEPRRRAPDARPGPPGHRAARARPGRRAGTRPGRPPVHRRGRHDLEPLAGGPARDLTNGAATPVRRLAVAPSARHGWTADG